METLDIPELINSLKNWDMWKPLIIVSVIGMLGSLAHKLTSPPEDKTSLPGYIVVGALAALAVLFIFTPSDAVRLIALSLVAGYGGKAILNALEARRKTDRAKAETAEKIEEGKKVVETAEKIHSYAQNLSRINKELEKTLIEATKQPREKILESLKDHLSTDVHSFIAKSPEAFADELKQLSNELGFLEESFKGKTIKVGKS